jgi:hypothetical protein
MREGGRRGRDRGAREAEHHEAVLGARALDEPGRRAPRDRHAPRYAAPALLNGVHAVRLQSASDLPLRMVTTFVCRCTSSISAWRDHQPFAGEGEALPAGRGALQERRLPQEPAVPGPVPRGCSLHP